MLAKDGKMRQTDVADTEQLFRLIQSVPSPKAEPFKMWIAKVARYLFILRNDIHLVFYPFVTFLLPVTTSEISDCLCSFNNSILFSSMEIVLSIKPVCSSKYSTICCCSWIGGTGTLISFNVTPYITSIVVELLLKFLIL